MTKEDQPRIAKAKRLKFLIQIACEPNSSFVIRHSSFGMRHLSSPARSWVTHWRQIFSKLRLLALGFSLLIRLARLLFRAGTRTSTS
jgi:hypothetical protein